MKQKALNNMADYCSKAERCTFDVRKKLQKYDITESERNDIILWLQKERFLDDERYACMYVRDKSRFNGWGPQKIRYQLINKHISSDIINRALTEIDTEQNSSQLRELLKNKDKSIKGDDMWKRRNQLIRFGISKGFDYESVVKALPKREQCDFEDID